MSRNAFTPGKVAVDQFEQNLAPASAYREDLNIIMVCPDCKEDPPNLIEEFAQGEIVCGSCGRVLADHLLDTRGEWRDHTNDYGEQEDHSRVGQAANPLYFGSQLHTEVSAFSGGARLSKRDRGLQRAQNKASKESGMEKWNQKLGYIYSKINTLCQSAGLPKTVQDQACSLYKAHFQNPTLKSCPQDGLIASVILLATRLMDTHRDAVSIRQLVGIDPKTFKAAFSKLREAAKKEKPGTASQHQTSQDAATQNTAYQVLGQSNIQDMQGTIISESITTKAISVKCVPGICSKLGITGRLQMQCEQAAEIENHHGLGEGKRPQNRAAACILLVCGEVGHPLEEKELAKAAGLRILTIKKLYKECIEPAAQMLVKPEWRPKETPLLLPA